MAGSVTPPQPPRTAAGRALLTEYIRTFDDAFNDIDVPDNRRSRRIDPCNNAFGGFSGFDHDCATILADEYARLANPEKP